MGWFWEIALIIFIIFLYYLVENLCDHANEVEKFKKIKKN